MNETHERVEEHTPSEESYSTGTFLKEIIKFAILALVIVFPLRMYVASPFIVNGSSMDPTFDTGNYLIVDKISYHLGEPERGDVVIFRYPRDPSKFFIKRIIALPGETITLSGTQVRIQNESVPEGFILDEPYIVFSHESSLSTTLDAGEYFVMGDNRAASSDSRSWGPLPREFIEGEALMRLIPPGRFAVFPGSTSYQE